MREPVHRLKKFPFTPCMPCINSWNKLIVPITMLVNIQSILAILHCLLNFTMQLSFCGISVVNAFMGNSSYLVYEVRISMK